MVNVKDGGRLNNMRDKKNSFITYPLNSDNSIDMRYFLGLEEERV